MDFTGDKLFGKSRLSFVTSIINKFGSVIWSFPTAAQEKFYQEALGNLARLLTNERNKLASTEGAIFSQCNRKCKNTKSRKDCLKEILNLLLQMQQKLLYDPPADDEIGYYMIIKKYMRSIIIFFEDMREKGLVDEFIPPSDWRRNYGHNCFYSPFLLLNHMTEVLELSKGLADLTAFVSEIDIRNGSASMPFMKDEMEVPPVIYGSKERSNAFYLHKFQLARVDLHYSEFAKIPPFAEEEISYSQVLDHMPPAVKVEDEANKFSDRRCHSSDEADEIKIKDKKVSVYPDPLLVLFLERIDREVSEMERHWKGIPGLILETLSLTNQYESIRGKYRYCWEDHKALAAELVEICGVSTEQLPNYITCVDRWLLFIDIILSFFGNWADLLRGLKKKTRKDEWKANAWEVVHILTLFKQGRYFFGAVLREHSMMSNILHNRDRMDLHHEGIWKGENENLKVLRSIIEDLRHIGDSDVKPDEEEMNIMYRIWQNVAASVHFFVCAMAYEQKRHFIPHGEEPDVRMLGLRASKNSAEQARARNRWCVPEEVLLEEVYVWGQIVPLYKAALLRKLGKSQKPGVTCFSCNENE